tara:strand:- start:73 stop:954 length:882 start_codon:yes stop_codon:yes gene_type:complete
MNIGQALRELDLRAGATEEEIRRAYRTLVAKWHPDKHQNDPIRLSEAELRIKNINRAFEKLQSVGFQTKKTTGKKDNTAEKNADTKKKSENGNKKQKADGKRNNPNQRNDSSNSTKTAKTPTSKKQWYSYLAIGLVGIALGYLANEIIIPPKTPNNGDQVLIASLEQKFGDCLYWDWVDLKTPNKIGVQSLYKADVIFKKKPNEKRLEHWPKNSLINQPEAPRNEGAKRFDHDYRILFRSGLSPELVVIEIKFANGDEGIWLWNMSSELLFPLGQIPYIGRRIPNTETMKLGL